MMTPEIKKQLEEARSFATHCAYEMDMKREATDWLSRLVKFVEAQSL